MARLNILGKGLILVAVPLLFQVGFIGLVVVIRGQATDAGEKTIHTGEVIAVAEACGYRLLAVHGAAQGYIITHDPRFGDDVRDLDARSRRSLGELRALVADNPSQAIKADEVAARSARLLDFIDQAARLLDRDAMPAELAASRRRQAEGLLADANRSLAEFIGAERVINSLRQESLGRAWHRLDWVLILGLVASMACSLLILFLFARNISDRLGILTSNSRRLSEGAALLPPIRGHDELARLDRIFRQMAEIIRESMGRERDQAALSARRADELADLNAQLHEKARENEMFVYSVSHDLRSPLVNLQGFSKELMLISGDLGRELDRDDVPEPVRKAVGRIIDVDMKESVGFIQSGVTRLSSIIDSLLRLSRAGRVEYREQMVDADAVVARIVRALRISIDERGAKVSLASLPPAYGDPSAIDQIFANLIGNAVNYLDPDRPGEIEVFAVDPVTLDEPVPPGSVVYAVKDNGLGIAEAYQGKIFSAFQRLHGNVAQGEGVGLALVRRVVERHGGRIWFTSAANAGTTFFFSLPGGPDEPDAPAPAPDDGPLAIASLQETA